MKTKYVIFKYLIADLLDYLNIKFKKINTRLFT